MRPIAWLSSVTVLVALTLRLAAHDGHGEVSILLGTVMKVAEQRIELETFDQEVRRTV
jgi:hypothetical protein